jgi:hypothetical protein
MPINFHLMRRAGPGFLLPCVIFAFGVIETMNAGTVPAAGDSLANPKPACGNFSDAAFGPPLGLQDPLVSKPVNVADLKQQWFHVGTTAFCAAVRERTFQKDPITGFKELAAEAGVDLSPPKMFSMVSEGTGTLFVSATTNDLEIIQGIIDGLYCPPPRIHIKARFIEVPQKMAAKLQKEYLWPGITSGIARFTNPQAQVFLHEVQQQPGVEELAEPEATTVPGGQVTMKSVIDQPVITDFTVGTSNTNGAMVDPQTEHIETSAGYFYTQHYPVYPQVKLLETGPTLDVIALTPADGYTLSLGVAASDSQFLGYAGPGGLTPHTVLPAVQLHQASTQQTVYDGQTLVLLLQPQKKDKDKVLVALVTATFIDPAGNRVHSDDEMPFAQTAFPPPMAIKFGGSVRI